MTEIRRARFHLWRALGKCDGFNRPTPGAMEPGTCQRLRTNFAREVFGELFVGGFPRIWRLFPVPFNSRAGNFDDHHLGTIGSTPRQVMLCSSYLYINVG
jgi:hypothetical protein